jgi:hypothetical protein
LLFPLDPQRIGPAHPPCPRREAGLVTAVLNDTGGSGLNAGATAWTVTGLGNQSGTTATYTFPSSRVGRATKLRLKVRFPGNAVLKAGSTTKTLVVRK